MKTISFDFDDTIWDTDFEVVIQSTLSLMQEHLNKGNRVIITTSRLEMWKKECQEILTEAGLPELEIFCAPGHPHFKPTELNKSDVLIRENVHVHFDDMKGDDVFIRALQAGIEIRLPPHMEQFIK